MAVDATEGFAFVLAGPAILAATSHIGIMAEAERIAELATPFLDDRGPPRPTGLFGGVDAPR